jgi:hypothetical protein
LLLMMLLFCCRGVDLDQLLDMNSDELIELFHARARRRCEQHAAAATAAVTALHAGAGCLCMPFFCKSAAYFSQQRTPAVHSSSAASSGTGSALQ